MPKVSALMPIYHTQESHLREAIESILAQTYTDFEFIILNNSPDNTGLDAIIASYNDERIVYSKNEKNIGISASRNKLLEMAQGAYLAIMDHDDISLPERFAKQVAFLDTHADVGLVGTWCKGFVRGQKWNTLTQHEDVERDLFFGCSIKHPSAMLRKSVLDTHKSPCRFNNMQKNKAFWHSYALYIRKGKHAMVPTLGHHSTLFC